MKLGRRSQALTEIAAKDAMKNFIFGLLVGSCSPFSWVVGYFRPAKAPVATEAPPMPMRSTWPKKALHAMLDHEMPKTVPIQG